MIAVAGYCRVSTDKEDQLNSFASQQRYFRAYIERCPDWELYEIYADEAVTGTSTRKRTQFNRMMCDARLGRFKLIITKEVSRFSRNILDTIAYTRELKALGVGVFFLNDGISTLEPDAELRLSIMGSIAQEESRKTSSRVKWGQTRQMERGVVFGRSMLGYDVCNGELKLNPAGAEIVRLIFHKYGAEKKGTTAIARELEAAGYRTYRGGLRWANSYIIRILKNEKYVGDLVQKKTYTPDYLSHAKRYNHGEEKMICLSDHHEPIVDRELWNTVQAELERRNCHGKAAKGHSNRYILSGKIRCGECGASFVARDKRRGDGSRYRKWGCRTAAGRRDASACDISRMLRDDDAMQLLKLSLGSLPMNTGEVIGKTVGLAEEAILKSGTGSGAEEEQLLSRLEGLTKKKEAMLDAFFSGLITDEEMRSMRGKYEKEQAALEGRLEQLRNRQKAQERMEDIRQELLKIVCGEKESKAFYRNLLDRMTVFRDGRVEVRLNALPYALVFRPGAARGMRKEEKAPW